MASHQQAEGRRGVSPGNYVPPPRVVLSQQYMSQRSNSDVIRRRNREMENTRNRRAASDASKSHLQYCQFKSVYTDLSMKGNRVGRPFQGRACHRCMPVSWGEFYTDSLVDMGFFNVLHYPYDNRRKRGVLSRLLPVMCLSCQQQSFQFNNIRTDVINHQRIKTAIDRSVNESMELNTESPDDNDTVTHTRMLRQQWKRVITIYAEMRATLSPMFIRFTGWFLHRILSLFLSTVMVNEGQMKMVKEASKEGVPIIYLPLHRSHLDYILITFLLWNWNIKPPHVAAGDNLRLPVFSKILRWLGGFFIKRKLDVFTAEKNGKKDHIYRALLHTYLETLLRKGESLEFYLEGGRTRTGKAMIPKGGLLSVVVNAVSEGIISDAYLVPIGMSYEKLLEGNFNAEQLGKPKQAETFLGTVKSIIAAFSDKYGNVRVDFCQPLSLKECIAASSNPQINTVLPSDMMRRDSSFNNSYGPVSDGSDGYRTTVKNLAEHVIYTAVHSTALMSTHLLAFLLLYRHRTGVKLETLVESFDWVRDEIMSRGRDVGFSGSSHDVINHAVSVLGTQLVSLTPIAKSVNNTTTTTTTTKQQQQLSGVNNNDVIMVECCCTIPSVFQLAYSANTVLSVFIAEAVAARAVCTVAGLSASVLEEHVDVEVLKQSVFKTSSQLCEVLINEFLFTPPCVSIDSTITEAIDKLVNLDILQELEEFDSGLSLIEKKCARTIAANLSWEDEHDEDDSYSQQILTESRQKYTVRLSNPHSKEWLLFLSGVAGPLLESYHTVACHLSQLKNNDMLESDFLKYVHNISKSKAEKKQLLYLESCGLESIRSAVKYFIHIKMLSTYSSEDNNTQKCVHLEDCTPAGETISDVEERFNTYLSWH